MRKVKVLKIEPLKHPIPFQLNTSIDGFNRAVSIGTDEICNASSKEIKDDVYILYNRNGYFYNLTPNRKVGKEIITGIFYIIACDENYHPRSLTQSEAKKYSTMFWNPEIYSDTEAIKNSLDTFCDSIDELENF